MKLNTLLLFIAISFSSICVTGQIAKRIDSLAREHVSIGFNGNILYSKSDSILFTGNYGYADFLTGRKLNDSTIFELASCSKQFTALAVVQLVEKNLFSYKTKVFELIPNFPYKKITVEHLLRHQSGLPDYQKLLYDKKIWDRRKIATNQDVLDILSQLKPALEFDPGSEYDYNNTGYAILASLIEIKSRQSYESYLMENILIPSGMRTSRVYSVQGEFEHLENVTTGHIYNKKKKKFHLAKNDINYKHLKWMNGIIGDRGVYASVSDLEKWKQALRSNILISQASKNLMFSTDNISTKYGYGLAIYKNTGKGRWVYHNGSWGGYKTLTLYLPETNELLVVLSNNRYNETYKKFEADLYKLIQ